MPTSEKRRRIVIFAGAGASRALKDSTFPTTVEFFEALPVSITSNEYFQFFEIFVRQSKTDTVLDIEEILLEIQRLIGFLESANDNSTIIGRAVSSNLLSKTHNGYSFGHLLNGGAQLSKELRQLQGRINEQVYRLYTKEPTDEELDGSWNPLLDHLLDSSDLDIFTTNYDLVIENSIQSVRDDKRLYSYLGATGRSQKHLDLGQWREDADRSVGLLTKLHGSLNWKLDDGRILLGDWAFTGNHAKQAIIYPGFKGESNALFFAPFHEYLVRTLARADHILVIGFAFRDDAINQIFRRSINPSAKITVIDHNEKLALPTGRKPIRFKEFNADTVSKFISLARKTS